MDIRLASRSDLGHLIRLNDQIQRQHAQQYPEEFRYPVNQNDVRAFFENLLRSGAKKVVVATENNLPFAYLYYEIQRIPENTFKFAKSRYYIHHVLVDEAVRRSGTASALFDWVDTEARSAGISEIALDTWMLNSGAHSFFEHKGFSLTQVLFSKALE